MSFGAWLLTACLLHYDPASYSSRARLRGSSPEPKRKRVYKGVQGRGLPRPSQYVAVDPKPKRSTHGQDEARVMPSGGPNPFMLKNVGMNCG